jgi:hypothetical protein
MNTKQANQEIDRIDAEIKDLQSQIKSKQEERKTYTKVLKDAAEQDEDNVFNSVSAWKELLSLKESIRPRQGCVEFRGMNVYFRLAPQNISYRNGNITKSSWVPMCWLDCIKRPDGSTDEVTQLWTRIIEKDISEDETWHENSDYWDGTYNIHLRHFVNDITTEDVSEDRFVEKSQDYKEYAESWGRVVDLYVDFKENQCQKYGISPAQFKRKFKEVILDFTGSGESFEPEFVDERIQRFSGNYQEHEIGNYQSGSSKSH